MRVDGAIGLSRRHAADDVADGNAAGARDFLASRSAASVSAVSPDCVMTMASVFASTIGIPVAILGAVVDFDRNARQLLDQELADEGGVPRGAACEDGHAVDLRQLRLRDLHLLEEHAAAVLRDAPEDRLARSRRLLEDLLEHEVLVAGLLRHDRIPQHALRGGRDRTAEEVGEAHAGARDDRHLFVAEEHHVARVAQDGRDVGRHEELAVAETHDDRRTVADRDDLLGVVGRDQHQREEPPHQHERAPHGVLEPVVLHLAFNEVRNDLGVGLGDELVPLALQFELQIEVVLDDAVVDDHDLAGAVAVRMCVFLGRPAVRRPARMADAVVAADRVVDDHFFQV